MAVNVFIANNLGRKFEISCKLVYLLRWEVFIADFSPLTLMEPIEPMESVDPETLPQISDGLRIIEDVTGSSVKFLMNKHQCESLTHRLYSIGEELKELAKEFVGRRSLVTDTVKMDYPAFEVLLTTLRKAEALLLKYRESSTSIPSVLTRGEDREAFKEIHADLDILNSSFQFESFEYVMSESEESEVLTANADLDLKDLSKSLDGLAHSGESKQIAELATNLEKVKLVISEKSEGMGDDLPSFLNIDPTKVEIADPVRMPERKSNHDPVETDGWALVHFGRYLGCKFALKVFRSGNTKWNRSELLKEVRSLMELHHPHIIQLMGFAQDEERCIILMELMDTDLRHFMKPRSSDGKRPFTRAEEMDIITQVAKGMYYLHEQDYVHGELKCSNILVKKIGNHIDVKISDLRSSQKLGVWNLVLFNESCKRRRLRWTAPEVQGFGEVGPTHEQLKKTDVYSFGMVCYEVLTGKLPFQDIREGDLRRRIETGDLKQELPGELDADGKLRGLIEKCWERDPNDRPTFKEICYLLDFIRSSQPPETNLTSGKSNVMRLFRLIPPIMRLRGKERNDPPAMNSWGHTDVGDGVHPAASGSDDTNAITLPEFVRIDPANLTKVRVIGEGGQAKVYEATWLGCRFAVKKFNVSVPTEVQKEVNILIQLRHPCIVRLMGLAVHSPRRCSIVMELMGCSLRKLINIRKQKRKVDPNQVHVPFHLHEAVHIITRIALGMAFLHSKGVAHRDLKADNVLVPDRPGSIDVKLADFGVSHLVDSGETFSLGTGTTFWRAPEIFGPSSLGKVEADEDQPSLCDLKAADVYSFAMTCYEVVTGGVPLEDEMKKFGATETRLAVVKGLRPELSPNLLPDLKLLIEECWDGNSQQRPTFSSILQKLQKIQQAPHSLACITELY